MTITPEQKLQATGLLYLGTQQIKTLNATESALAKLLGDDQTGGHCGDFIYGENTDIDSLIEKLKIEIAEPN